MSSIDAGGLTVQLVEHRILGHAVAAAMVAPSTKLSTYVSEAAAWTAEAYASASEAGIPPLRAVLDDVPHLRDIGASDAEVAFIQLVAAEIDAMVQRRRSLTPALSVAALVRRSFRWTESPRFADGLTCELTIVGADELDEPEQTQALTIYRIAMLQAFRGEVCAFRAWSHWHLAPSSTDARRWKRLHAKATSWAFAGLQVNRGARVAVRFELRQ